MVQQNVCIEIEAVVEATMVRNDYGVPGSPVWYEPEDLKLASVWMFGRDWTRQQLVEKFGKQGADAIEELVCDETCEDSWED